MSVNSSGENPHFSFRNTLLMIGVSGGLFSMGSILHQMDHTMIAVWLYILATVPVGGYVLGTYFGIKERRMWMNYERKLMQDRNKQNSSDRNKTNKQSRKQQQKDDYRYKPKPSRAKTVKDNLEDLV